MLSVSKFSKFNTTIGFSSIVPNRGNNFTFALSLPTDFSGANIGGGKYFITRYNAATVSSGTSWGSLSSSVPMTFQPAVVAYNGSNEFIAAGQDTSYLAAKFASSSNGTTWTELPSIYSPNDSGIWTNGLIWDGIRFIAGGRNAIFTGTTGGGLQLAIANIPSVLSIASNQTRAVYVGTDNLSIYFTDSLFQSITQVANLSPVAISSIAYGNGIFVIAGQGIVYISSDGINWSTITNTIFGTDYMYSIAYHSNCFYMLGAGKNLYLSTNGVDWTKKITAIPVPGFITFASLMVDANLISVAIASGSSQAIYTSP